MFMIFSCSNRQIIIMNPINIHFQWYDSSISLNFFLYCNQISVYFSIDPICLHFKMSITFNLIIIFSKIFLGQLLMSKDYWKFRNGKSKTFMYTPTQHDSNKPVIKTTGRWLYGKGKTPSILKIATWNVNGIRSIQKKGELSSFIKKSNLDFICINQTKINEQAFDKERVQLEGYIGYWNFCKVSSGYSGVAVFTKHLAIRMEQDLPQRKHQHQGRLITLQYQRFFLIAVYVPNSGSNQQRLPYRVNEWDVDFRNYCQQLRRKKNVIICGDLNVVRGEKDIHMAEGGQLTNRKKPGCNLIQRQNIQTFLNKYRWIDTWRQWHPNEVKYTWWNLKIKGRKNGVGWRIDYILVNQQMRNSIQSVNIRDQVLGSDHCPVEATLNLDKIPDRRESEVKKQQGSLQKIWQNQQDEDKDYYQNQKKMKTQQLVKYLDILDEDFRQEQWLGEGEVQKYLVENEQKEKEALSIFSPIKNQGHQRQAEKEQNIQVLELLESKNNKINAEQQDVKKDEQKQTNAQKQDKKQSQIQQKGPCDNLQLK